MEATLFNDTSFEVLDFSLSLVVVLVIFAIIAVVSLTIYFLILFKKSNNFYYEKEEVSANEFKRLEKFEDERNNFELEIAKIRKIQRSRKK